ncbi:MAG TPA: DUF4041 domain-containing protein [bacterium]|nr:DUF4041 domain-containing protein [bacterium]
MDVITAMLMIALFIIITFSAILIIMFLKQKKIIKKYSPIIDIDKEVIKANKLLKNATDETEKIKSENEKLRKKLSDEYLAAKAIYEKLQKEISLLEENIEDISFGLYKPHYSFDSSDAYKRELDSIRARQKDLIKGKKAALCAVEWTVSGSKKEGARMQNQYMKLLLRAFNGECDAAVAKVTWNNVTRMENRITSAFEVINKLGSVMKISISDQYLSLKMEELRLEFETKEKRQQEIEEQRAIQQQIREEEKALKEAEKARKEAEQEEARSIKALEKAREELQKAHGGELDVLNEKILLLEQQLTEAQKQKERAISLAQITKSGHVYIISNIGSFGDNVLKIGMTRRLEPMDRVKELGDASVPFQFDVHAMIYSKDAPSLEKELHDYFSEKRVNLINQRKEYFFTTVEEIEEFARSKDYDFKITRLAEAKEYRESLTIRESKKMKEEILPIDEKLPERLFSN